MLRSTVPHLHLRSFIQRSRVEEGSVWVHGYEGVCGGGCYYGVKVY